MKAEAFNDVVEAQMKTCRDMLVTKAGEYANDGDRLHNFKVAAELQGVNPRKALAGMMAKHTVSVYDLCYDEKLSTPEVWDEKITDHINYLLLLRAIVREERGPLITTTQLVSDRITSDHIIIKEN